MASGSSNVGRLPGIYPSNLQLSNSSLDVYNVMTTLLQLVVHEKTSEMAWKAWLERLLARLIAC